MQHCRPSVSCRHVDEGSCCCATGWPDEDLPPRRAAAATTSCSQDSTGWSSIYECSVSRSCRENTPGIVWNPSVASTSPSSFLNPSVASASPSSFLNPSVASTSPSSFLNLSVASTSPSSSVIQTDLFTRQLLKLFQYFSSVFAVQATDVRRFMYAKFKLKQIK